MNDLETTRDRRGLVIATIAGAILVLGLGTLTATRIPAQRTDCTPLAVSASQEKAALLGEIATALNSESRVSSSGPCVVVKITAKPSGAAEEALTRGWDERSDGPRPDVWSPASTSWTVLLQEHRAGRDAKSIVPDRSPSLLQSPLVIAMPVTMAQALGWPDRPIGWSDLLALARDPAGWGALGHPEWGHFRMGKTNPAISTSGLHALIAAYFAATGRSADLTDADVTDPKVITFVKGVESSVVHYGETVSTFLRNLRAADDRGAALSYVSAIAVEEKQVWDYNQGVGGVRPAMPLAAVYPKEGTLVADHPYVVLNVPWVDDGKRAAAAQFLAYIQRPEVQQRFRAAGFRDHQGVAGPEISAANGLLPAGPAIVIAPPAPAVLAHIQQSWAEVRKRARVLMVLDVSGSMSGTKIDLMKRAAAMALDQFADDDEVGLWTFESQHRELVPISPVAQRRDEMKSWISKLVAGGGTALYATVHASVDHMTQRLDSGRINAVLFLTDGKNEAADRDLDRVLRELQAEDEERRVRVFTIAYGADADQKTLKQIAEASRGAFYDATNPATIEKVFTDVVSNF
jgi:Ca-activated chloride channel family protein